MKMLKALSRASIILISVLGTLFLALVVCLAMPWAISYAGEWLSPDPPTPHITYGEFPFELVYTIDGETVTINDVYICEYEGISIDEGQGKHVEWKGYIQSSRQEQVVLLVRDTEQIVCEIGEPEYYMGDAAYCEAFGIEDVTPCLVMIENDGEISSCHVLDDEEKKEYHIEIISWRFSKPIQNTFS